MGWERLCWPQGAQRSHLRSTYYSGKHILLGEFRAGTRVRQVRHGTNFKEAMSASLASPSSRLNDAFEL